MYTVEGKNQCAVITNTNNLNRKIYKISGLTLNILLVHAPLKHPLLKYTVYIIHCIFMITYANISAPDSSIALH